MPLQSTTTDMHKLVAIAAVLLLPIIASSQVTYAEHIAPIIYDHCTTCHRQGEIGPFELTSYEDVRDRALMIKAVTTSKYMPPWKPDPSFSHLQEENYLSDDEISLIAEWVDGDRPYGNAADEPPLPAFPEGSLLGEPDLVLEFVETHLHLGNNQDEYRYFVLPTGLTEDKVVKAIEMRPGNSKIVHHALFFEDTEGRAASFDALTPEYGFVGVSGFDTDQVLAYDNFPGYVPGTKPIFYPEGIGQQLTAGSDLVTQVHYAPWPTDEEDRSSVNIFFADEDEEITRLVDDRVMLPYDLDGGFASFFLPPNQIKTFHGSVTMTEDRSLIAVSPHMHFLGRNWEVWLETPEGERVDLVKIPDWDFNWQGYYYFPRYIVAKAGSVVHATATYDNTADNPTNPSNPPKFVSWGEGTTDEMYFLPILSVPYQDGDEDVLFTATDELPGNVRMPVSEITAITPNPSSGGQIAIDFSTGRGEAVSIRLLDEAGKVVRTLRQSEYFRLGSHRIFMSTDALNSGTYYINIHGKHVNTTKAFIRY